MSENRIEMQQIVDQEEHDFADMKARHFKARAKMALENETLRASFRGASDFLMAKRKSVFPDDEELEALRDRGEAARQRSLQDLPELLEMLEANLTRNGVQVHWAETADDACKIIHGIMEAGNAKTLVKGKSMVSEEIELNHYLEKKGIECLESDMGEYLVQLGNEAPSHIVMPVIHKNKRQIARLMHTRATTPDGEPVPYSEDVDDLIGNARAILREKFRNADAGLSGVNMAIAETGTLLLVENEGNGRMSTTVPPIHIAVTGIEKVVRSLTDVPELLTLLPRSATGQLITTYVNMISGPRQPGELDGPQQVHLVLVDNGRSRMYNHPQLKPTLQCIRCGACMNHCPVYARVGGHAYGSTYPGPIGQVVTPQLGNAGGLAANGDMINACSLNGACGEACPVRIPLPDLIRELRAEAARPATATALGMPVPGTGSRRNLGESLIWTGWSTIYKVPFLYRTSTRLMGLGRSLMPGKLAPWTNTRSMPKPAARSLHQLARDAGVPSTAEEARYQNKQRQAEEK
ncbi:LutB/LldF family L-lactate oxidation iron-sulfur protein [Parathalassolituus penaei]|uniref:LutB/LldF family L-lactate oxidation iron-sulfur protein n=1 Tax=Parathalassolituus penaei TaxID=2997323 RepID=A0A9X3EBL3_9GAMM|nr:LutB/LldF family L-lactate oxidation iron-sulfur protein [Parathalassolituus penaei]MCY0964559.1 LutB/LldF family L-lactate oxidation iron-sulfur protein [Parathalassolituus penaei]